MPAAVRKIPESQFLRGYSLTMHGRLGIAVALTAGLLWSHAALAQLRWDVGARIGASKRFASQTPESSESPGAGPAAAISLHTALLPLLRVGPAFASEFTPVNGRPTRGHYGLGIDVRVFAPLPTSSLRAFLYFGLRGVLANQGKGPNLESGRGGYAAVPFGIGASYKLIRHLSAVATVGGDATFAHGGSLYDKADARFVGYDRLGVRGLVGVDLDF
jgi:hypothetical protein